MEVKGRGLEVVSVNIREFNTLAQIISDSYVNWLECNTKCVKFSRSSKYIIYNQLATYRKC